MAMDPIREVIARLVEHVEHRHYGKYRGIVTRVDDPLSIGRIRARVPQLTADTELGWALPCLPFGGMPGEGLFTIPSEGAGVWVEFEGGDLSHPVWTGAWWGRGDVPEDATPAQKVFRTSAGHVVVLDDDEETLTITDANGNSVTMDSDGMVLADANGSTVTMDSNGVTIDAPTVIVGGTATDHLVGHKALDQALQALAKALSLHTHGTGVGPSTPPTSPIVLSIDPAKSRHGVEL
jgi:uncharacterized protein involved in type VI secretion and phage assembly